ncbi:MAG TPA: hypothetical protein V6D47_19755 [Oscillatoriaceae cyanobacterium]
MRYSLSARVLLASTCSMALLAGCAGMPTGALSALTGSTTGNAFVSSSALNAAVSAASVTTSTQAKALSVYDENVVEGASAALEQTEAGTGYKVASLDDPSGLGDLEGSFRNQGRQAPQGQNGQPPQGENGQPPQMQGGGFGGPQGPGFGGPQGQDANGAPNPQASGAQPPMPGMQGGFQQGMAANFKPGGFERGRDPGQQGGFQFGQFGGGGFSMQGGPRLEHHAQPPARNPKLDDDQLGKLRQDDQQNQSHFVQAHPNASSDEALIAQVLSAQSWQPSQNDSTTVFKNGTATMALSNGVSRKIAVLRVIDAQAPHALVQAQTDIDDTEADGGTHTVHWEKSLQADGSYSIAFHEEITTAKGIKWVADWTKTQGKDGTLSGSGTFTETDATGKVVAQETLAVGGSAASGEAITTVSATGTDTTASATATASDATAASGTTDATASDSQL